MNIPNTSQPASQPLGIGVGDIYYILFRHKWKIIICSLLGIGAAAAAYKLQPINFESEATILIRYVMDNSELVGTVEKGVTLTSPDQGGVAIINTEIEIITSLNLAEQVAKTIGPEKILASYGHGNSLNGAAALIQASLTVTVPPRSNVLHLAFKHRDPALVQPILAEVIDSYLKRHSEIHRESGLVNGFLAQQTDLLRSRLAQTEEELRKARNKAGIISIDDAKKGYSDQIAKIRQEILNAQAELAERSSMLQEMTRSSPDTPKTEGTETLAASPEPSADQVKQYRSLLRRQDAAEKREQDLLAYVREDNPRLLEVQAQLSDIQTQRKTLETAYPKLARTVVTLPSSSKAAPGQLDLASETARTRALEAKIKVLNSQLDEVRTEAANTDQLEASIRQLMRQKELEEANYKNYAASLEQERINETMGRGSVSNIITVQTPSPPGFNKKQFLKIPGVLAAGGIAAGIAWALLIEFFLDRSIRRPVEVERLLRMPLFISIPKLSRKELSIANNQALLELQNSTNSKANAKSGAETALVPWSESHPLHIFHETLRDRLISYFESINLTHKPKLVAVTGLDKGGGVTTTAAGLARSLSETGDGNVLLVDMTKGQGSAQQFYQGKAVCGLEEVLDARDNAQIEGNLFVVGEEPGSEKLSRILPQRFNKLVPKLKASNFDYIIFDMPAVSQISITPRLAGFMDMVLLVIESEKTDREMVQRATALLAESKAHVGAVLNKTQNYVPARLHQENLGNS